MATHSKKVSKLVTNKILVFTDNPNVSAGSVTFAAGDYIDVRGSLGRDGKGCKVIVRGSAVIELNLNSILSTTSFNESQVDTTIDFAEDLANINGFILVAGTQEFLFPISLIKIAGYLSGGTSANNVTIIVY